MAILNPFRWIGPRNVCDAEIRYLLTFVEVLAALCKIAEKNLDCTWLVYSDNNKKLYGVQSVIPNQAL